MNPDGWPNVHLKPATGSVKGLRHEGPGGEKIPQFGRVDGQSPFRTIQWRCLTEATFERFDGSGSFILPGKCDGVASVRQAVTGVWSFF